MTAIDNDPEAVRVARENVAANRLAHLVTVGGDPLAALPQPFVSDHRAHKISGHRVPPPALMAAASPTAMRTPVREPARSPQDAVPCDRLQPFAVVIANIIHDVLLALAPELTRLVRPGGHLILAGILSGEQAENIRRCYSGLGFSLQLQPVREEWTAFLFRRQGHTP